jgi:hypothetical protein
LGPPVQKPAGIGATVSATLETAIRGTFGRLELSDCVWGVVFICVLISGLIAEAHQSRFADLLVWGPAIGLALLAANRIVQSWWKPAGPVPAQAVVTPGSFSVSLYADSKDIVAMIRELQLGRQPLHPDGEIIGNDPSDDASIRTYTAEEREAESKRIAAATAAHDREIVDRAEQIAQEIISAREQSTAAIAARD